MKRGKLYVISGPSGVGKGTICRKLIDADDNIRFSVSMTTRNPREGEADEIDYYFISKKKFEKLLSDGELLEYNCYVNNYYGTPKKPIFEWTSQGYDVILEIDYHGAFQVKKTFPEVVLIFLMPPSVDELKTRIIGRGSETKETMKKRLEEARNDLIQANKYDYRVLNEDIDAAVKEVQRIIKIERNKEE